MPVFGHRTKHHMALAQYLMNKRYFEFFARKVEDKEVVILDNGTYESRRMSPVDLAVWATRLKPTVVVLPDVPGDMLRTYRDSMNYLDKFGVPVEAMMVLHAPNGQTPLFEKLYENCPVGWVGFSKLTRYYGIDNGHLGWPEHRWSFMRHLKRHGMYRQELKHHALGMLNGDVAEMGYLAENGFESCDSSAPIWRGLHGYALEDTSWCKWAFEPECHENVNNLVQAGKNLDQVLEACNEDRSGNGTEVAGA